MSKKSMIFLLGMASFVQAEFLVQGSFALQMNDKLMRLTGYDVNYSGQAVSPYDLSVGYMLSFKDVAVMPIMLEGKSTTLESYLNASDMEKSKVAPLEVLLKPGLRLLDSDVYVIIGYQLGDFKQKVQLDGHDIELRVKPNFYGAGYTKMLSDYLDYIIEAKVYYVSQYSYGFDFGNTSWDPNLKISDARFRVGFRIKI